MCLAHASCARLVVVACPLVDTHPFAEHLSQFSSPVDVLFSDSTCLFVCLFVLFVRLYVCLFVQ